MKKAICIILASAMLMSILSIGAYAIPVDDEIAHGEPAVVLNAVYDFTQMPEILKEYRKGTFEYDETKFDTLEEWVDETLDTVSEQNNVILPFAVDFDEIEPGDFTFEFYDSGIYRVIGKYDGISFRIEHYFSDECIKSAKKNFRSEFSKYKNAVSKKIGAVTVSGVPQKANEPGYCEFYFETNDGCYKIFIYGDNDFDAIFDKLELTICPLVNGFVRADGKIYYSKDGAFLKGWYKIGGSKYYFKTDGSAATKITKIGGVYHKFDENGVYIGKFTGTAKVGGKSRKFVDGVIVD
jgi:hypothetical protein